MAAVVLHAAVCRRERRTPAQFERLQTKLAALVAGKIEEDKEGSMKEAKVR